VLPGHICFRGMGFFNLQIGPIDARCEKVKAAGSSNAGNLQNLRGPAVFFFTFPVNPQGKALTRRQRRIESSGGHGPGAPFDPAQRQMSFPGKRASRTLPILFSYSQIFPAIGCAYLMAESATRSIVGITPANCAKRPQAWSNTRRAISRAFFDGESGRSPTAVTLALPGKCGGRI